MSLAWPCPHLQQASLIPLALSSPPAGFPRPAGFQPLEAGQRAAPHDRHAFCRACTAGPPCSPALRGGSRWGQEGLSLLSRGLCETPVNCKRVVCFSMVGIGTHSSLGESPALHFFISSGKNATSVQRQPETFYEWDPLNYNISEFPKAVNRISCIVEEVLSTYTQTQRLFASGSCSSGHAVRPGILLPLCCFLVPRKRRSAGRRGENGAIGRCWAVCGHTLC